MRFARVLMISIPAALILGAGITNAAEGMWPLYELNKLPFDTLKSLGLFLSPEEIYNPQGTGIAGAVVQMGATGSFVSPQGLILTNHHVAFGAIQKQSTPERNYLRDGFYAASLEEEIPALDYRVYVTLSIQDVTDQIIKAIPENVSDLGRYQVIDKKAKEIIKRGEQKGGVKCRVARTYGGKQYMLHTYFEINDVRIVYVPPEAIGNYGGDIDNWMWPRHTGDFSFLRAYVSPSGKSAPYAKENVPYHPKVYLPISLAGVKEGNFALTLGFPGKTDRYISSYEVEFQLNRQYPRTIATLEDLLKILSRAGETDSAVSLRLASEVSGLNNWLKKSYGVVEGFADWDIISKKRAEEERLTEFLGTRASLQQEYGQVLPELDRLYASRQLTDEMDHLLSWLNRGVKYLSLASDLYKWSLEREKPDLERERGYQDRDTASTVEELKNTQRNLVPSVDKEKFRYFIKRALQLPPGQRVKAIDKIVAGKSGAELDKYLEEYLTELYDNSKVGELQPRLKMFYLSKSELQKLDDPFMNLAIELRPEFDAQLERSKALSGAQSRLSPKLIQAYAEWKKAKMYPDANGTMRLSYGVVKGNHPRDAVSHSYLTTLTGVMEKETGRDPFIVPAELKSTFSANKFGRYRDSTSGDVPVDFLTTNDITGGNSGSPVINGRGEIIGLAFDGNWEGVASDYLYNPEVTRTISVDIRYVLFLIDTVYHLDNLVKELTVH